MRTRFVTILLATAALGLSAGGVFAQPAAPAPDALTQTQPVFDYNQLPAIKGTVKFFTLTPRGDVDGFVMADGTQVHLPPHLSTQLVAAVRIGDAVTVHGLKAAAFPMVAAMSVTGDTSHQTVVDMGPPGGPDRGPGGPGGPGGPRPPHGPPPPAGPPSQVTGKVMLLLHGPRGEANGAMLEDGTVLRLPPPEATRLAATMAPGQTVVAQGSGIANNLGRMIEVRAIGPSADALQQLPPPPPPPGSRGDRHGPRPGGPDAPPPPGGPNAPPAPPR